MDLLEVMVAPLRRALAAAVETSMMKVLWIEKK
jgi:hypothetical protein